jgi:predicted metal-dependent HD superfamily phosphohydrolase
MSELSARFSALWQRCSDGELPAPVIWETIERRYREPHRHYHNLGHLEHCLTELDLAGEKIEEADATEMAIWFHDIIYEYAAKDNEELSAETFREHSAGALEPRFADRVYDFILATKHIGTAPDEATAYLVDIDLSGFGLPWEGYLADSNALREEAPNVSEEQYYAGKLRFLDGLLSWSNIFQTRYFNERLEATARANISRYTDQLRSQGFG